VLKKNVTYTDFNGQTVTEEFRFHLSKAELVEMEAERRGGLAAYLQRIVETNDGAAIINAFKDLLQRSVGRVSQDGRRFIKNPEIVDDFMESPAYSVLFMELATKADAAAEFVNGIIPEGLGEEVAEIGAVAGTPQRERDTAETTPAPETKPDRTAQPVGEPIRLITKVQLAEMTPEQYRLALKQIQDGTAKLV